MPAGRKGPRDCEVLIEPPTETPRLGDRPAERVLALDGFVDRLEEPEATPLPADCLEADKADVGFRGCAHSPFTIPSTIFLASANSIMVLSRKNSSFST